MMMPADPNNVEPLGDDYMYEGWLIVDSMPVSTGVFSVDDAGNTHPDYFLVNAYDAANATTFVLTIEPADDPDPAPAHTHYLAGDFNGRDAMITIDHGAALGDDFSMASGAYILNTPSTAGDDTDYDQGIWWLDPAMGPGPSLDLPVLPAGWAYEGWVAGMDGPVTTGRFLMADEADDDAGGPTAGPDAPFPARLFRNDCNGLTGHGIDQ